MKVGAVAVSKNTETIQGVTEGASPLSLSNPKEQVGFCDGFFWGMDCVVELQFPRGASNYSITIQMQNLDVAIDSVNFQKPKVYANSGDQWNFYQTVELTPSLPTTWGYDFTYYTNLKRAGQCGRWTTIVNGASAGTPLSGTSIEDKVKSGGYKMYVYVSAYWNRLRPSTCTGLEEDSQTPINARVSVTHGLVPLFGDVIAGQTNPIAGEANTIKFSIKIVYLLAAMQGASIYIKGDDLKDVLGSSDSTVTLVKTGTLDDHVIFCSDGTTTGTASYTASSSPAQIELKLCTDEEMDGGRPYEIGIEVTNPSETRSAGTFTVSSDFGKGSSYTDEVTATAASAAPDVTDSFLLAGFADALKIMKAGFGALSLTQSVPFTASANVLTMQFQVNKPMSAMEKFTLSGFSEKATIVSDLTFLSVGTVITEAVSVDSSFLDCDQCGNCNVFTASTGTFKDRASSDPQYASNSNCQWVIAPTGASDVRDFVWVYSCEDVQCSMSGRKVLNNRLTGWQYGLTAKSSTGIMMIEFRSDGCCNDLGFEVEWSAAVGQIAISPVADLLCKPVATGDATAADQGTWDSSNQELVFQLCLNAEISAGPTYALLFNVTNGPYQGSAPNISVEVTGTTSITKLSVPVSSRW